MKTPDEISRILREKVSCAMKAAGRIKSYRLEYVDVNVTAEPGEPALYKEKGCNGAELLCLLDAFDRMNTQR